MATTIGFVMSVEEIIGKQQTRSFELNRADIDEETRTVKLAFASDKPVEHWFGLLRLSMAKGACRTERLESGAPLLLDHDRTGQVGVTESHSFDTDGMARAVVRFSKSEKAEEIFQDVKDGIRRNVSVGFLVHAIELESEQNAEMPVYRSDDWEVLEISLVSVPADISAGVGRAKITETEKKMAEEIIKPAQESEAVTLARTTQEFVEFATSFGDFKELARTYALDNKSLDDLKAAIRAERAKELTPPTPPKLVEPVRAIVRHGRVKSFQGEKAVEKAYRFGQFILAAANNERALQFCRENGLMLRAQNESVNEKGGFLVPEEFGTDLIDLREQFGVFRRNAKIQPMSSDTRTDPRRVGGLTAYFKAESAELTASEKNWDNVALTAKKLTVLARYSSEISEDAVISIGDDLASEVAYAFANKEDECGFNGDASSTYGGIVGVREKLKGLDGTIANIAGLKVGSGNAYSELTLTDFEGVVGLLPQYADRGSAKWFVHRSFFFNVMVKLMLASGGVTSAEVANGVPQRFMGYAVEFAQVLPKDEANSQVCALFGDLALAASLGSRRDTTIALSEHSRFAFDEMEIKGTERFDINVHSVGNASATAASRQPGPIVGLITAAS